MRKHLRYPVMLLVALVAFLCMTTIAFAGGVVTPPANLTVDTATTAGTWSNPGPYGIGLHLVFNGEHNGVLHSSDNLLQDTTAHDFGYFGPFDPGTWTFWVGVVTDSTDVEVARSNVVTITAPEAVSNMAVDPSVNAQGWINHDATVSLNVAPLWGDAIPFVAYSYTTNGYDIASFVSYDGTPFVVSGEGETVVTWSAYGMNNFDYGGTGSFKIDKTAPTITSDVKASYDTSAVITLDASDALSGVGTDSLTWRLDSGVAATGTVITTVPGAHHLHATVTDNAGNQTDFDTDFVVNVTIPNPVRPGAPTNLTVGKVASGYMGSWGGPTADASSTSVWVDQIAAPTTIPSTAANLASDATTYTAPGLTPGTWYFHVARVGAGGTSPITTTSFVVPKTVVTTKMALTVAKSVRRNKSISAKAVLSPASAGGTVSFTWYRYYSKRWHRIKITSAKLVGGKAVSSYKPTVKGSWEVTANYGGQSTTTTIFKASSATKKFTVN